MRDDLVPPVELHLHQLAWQEFDDDSFGLP
jgi:hypothetical protein